jgi:hypothetical protein
MSPIRSFTDLPDRELLTEVKRLADTERHATAALVASLAEIDARRLYLGEGCSSLFTYCTQVLHLSEHAAYGRIEAARAGRRLPLVLRSLATGDVTLTAVCLLAPHLTDDNHRDLLATARHKSKREVEHLIAALRPRPDVPSTVRRLPTATLLTANASPSAQISETDDPVLRAPLHLSASTAAQHDADVESTSSPESVAPTSVPRIATAPTTRRPGVVAPLRPERYRVQFSVGRETHDKLRRAQDLLRHAVPNGDPAEIFDRALTLLVEQLEKSKLAQANRPRAARSLDPESRHVPASVRRAVWKRDEGRCAFAGTEGRCTETGFLEFHHVVPYASGGATTVDNIVLLCRAHNQYESAQVFGPMFVRERPDRYEYSSTVVNQRGANRQVQSALDNAPSRSGPSQSPSGPRAPTARVRLQYPSPQIRQAEARSSGRHRRVRVINALQHDQPALRTARDRKDRREGHQPLRITATKC